MRNEEKIRDAFRQAVDDLYKQAFYLAGEVTKLGYPELLPAESSFMSTACVIWDDHQQKAKFLFNEGFFESLTQEEFNFVVAHETIHLLNLHLLVMKKEFEKKKLRKASNMEMEAHRQKLNIAADCVVNDSLTNLYGLNRHKTLGPIKTIYGEDVVQTDTEDLSVMDVFYLLPEDLSGYGVIDHKMWDSFFDEDGNLKKEFVDKIGQIVEGNLGNSALSEADSRMIEGLKDAMSKSSDPGLKKAGDEAKGQLRSLYKVGANALNWERILVDLTEYKKAEDSWNRAPRKLSHVYPDVILPQTIDAEREELLVFVDASGSIDMNALALFRDVLVNTPKRFKIHAVSFDTQCYEYDIVKGEKIPGGGGTNFGILNEYVKQNCKKHPKAIIVLTDGEGTPVSPQRPNKWCWLLTGRADQQYLGKMRRHLIKDLLK